MTASAPRMLREPWTHVQVSPVTEGMAVVSVVAEDRTGLLHALADCVQRVHPESLVAEARVTQLLRGTHAQVMLVVRFSGGYDAAALQERIAGEADVPGWVVHPQRHARLLAKGPQGPGVLRDVSGALASEGVNIEAMVTESYAAELDMQPEVARGAQEVINMRFDLGWNEGMTVASPGDIRDRIAALGFSATLRLATEEHDTL